MVVDETINELLESDHWLDREAGALLRDYVIVFYFLLFTVGFLASLPVRFYRWFRGFADGD